MLNVAKPFAHCCDGGDAVWRLPRPGDTADDLKQEREREREREATGGVNTR